MRGGEKPFEILSSKEKEAFELCKEILQWSGEPGIITLSGVIQLREDATKLYEVVSKMDMEHDDRYYEVHAEIDRVRKRYQDLREMVTGGVEWEWHEYYPEKDDIEDLEDVELEKLNKEFRELHIRTAKALEQRGKHSTGTKV